MTEEVQAILQEDIIVSKKRGAFSTPTEITNHLNTRLDSAYSTKAIAECLKLLGWRVSGKKRIKRKGKACNFYHLQGDIESKALLSTSATTNAQPSSKGEETLSSISRRFRSAQADKERSLANTRHVETNTAKYKAEHERIELAKKRNEYVLVKDVIRDWNEALLTLKSALYTIPLKYSERWASEKSDQIIHDEIITELDAICTKLAASGEDAVKPTNEKKFSTDTESDIENEARG